MDPEEKKVIDHIKEVSEENNRILKNLESTARWSWIFWIIKWAIIIGIAIGAFYYLQPIFEKIDIIYNYITDSHLPNFQDFINKFR